MVERLEEVAWRWRQPAGRLLIEVPSLRRGPEPDLSAQMELSGLGKPVVLDLPSPDSVIHLGEVPIRTESEVASSALGLTGGRS